MATEWVDFKVIKEAVNMQMVLDHYGISGLTKHSDELRGPCPIHKGLARSKNFTVSTRKKVFKCFLCGARGNVLDFVAAMEKCSIHDAALKLRAWFKLENNLSTSLEEIDTMNETFEYKRGIYRDAEGWLYELIARATSADNLNQLIVYRELFGDYRCLVAPTQNFVGRESCFTLVKEL